MRAEQPRDPLGDSQQTQEDSHGGAASGRNDDPAVIKWFKDRWGEEWIDADDVNPVDHAERRHYAHQALAHRVKTRLQQAIGVAGVILLFYRVAVAVLDSGVRLTDTYVLRVAAVTLAAATVVELAYTLFTPGPDEAINPLLLGLSSSTLFLTANQTQLTAGSAAGTLLLVGALAVLFIVRRIFIESKPAEHEANSAGNRDRAAVEDKS